MTKYIGQWTANLPEEEKKDFEEYLRNSKKLLDRLHKICYNMVNELEGKVSSDYDNPNWAYRQADANGYIRALNKVMKLCETE